MITGWKTGNLNNNRARWSVNQCNEVSAFLENCKLPSEIHRKMRGLNELAFWKGTEYRSFLLYPGIVLVKKFFDDPKIWQHFLLFYCAVVICTRNDQPSEHLNIAESMFKDFLINFKTLYGIDHFSSNLHNICHVVDDVRKFGPLNTFSAYPFESKLYLIKRLLRNGNLPLSQVSRRISELQKINILNIVSPKDMNNFELKKELKNFHITDQSLLSFLKKERSTLYSQINLLQYLLSTDDDKNRWFLSKTLKIISLKYIIKTQNSNNVYLYGSELASSTDYFQYPLCSSELNIYESNLIKNPPKFFRLTDIFCKMVRIEYNTQKSIFIPLYHTIVGCK